MHDIYAFVDLELDARSRWLGRGKNLMLNYFDNFESNKHAQLKSVSCDLSLKIFIWLDHLVRTSFWFGPRTPTNFKSLVCYYGSTALISVASGLAITAYQVCPVTKQKSGCL